MPTRAYGVVGTGHRAGTYVAAMTGAHADVAELRALCDVNPGRMRVHAARVTAAGGPAPRQYAAAELERMVAEAGLDRVIVTTPDHTHAEVVVRALRAGVDVVVEKPLTTDAAGARAIAEAVEETGREVVVTFNYRYSPRNSALREVLAAGRVGAVTSVHFEWVLDTAHGADYFRRWHRDKARSGGLLVHKSSHHFDLVNWWLDDVPARVYASGGLRFYGEENARRRGLGPRPRRGSDPSAAGDPFTLDLAADAHLRELYLENEAFDGYLRDLDVFGPGITIEDNLALVVDYAGGPSMSYALNAHAPWEGYTVAVNGTEGRAELTVVERGSLAGHGALDPSATARPGGAAPGAGQSRPEGERLVVQRHWEDPVVVPVAADGGSHGGGDDLLLRDVFVGAGDDPLGRPAGLVDGIAAIAVGVAGNASLERGVPVRTADLSLGVDLARRARRPAPAR